MFDFLGKATSWLTGGGEKKKEEQPAAPPPPPPAAAAPPPPPPAAAPTKAAAPKVSATPQKPGQETGPAPATQPAAVDPNQPQPPVAAQEEEKIDQAAMSKAAAQIFKAADGWGTDEASIHSALKGRSPKEIAAIKAEYQAHYGKSLDSVLEDELSGEDLESAKAAMTADPVKSAAATLKLAASGWGTDEDTIKDTLKGLKPEERKQVEAEFAKNNGGKTLTSMLESEMSGADLAASKALASGDIDQADAIMLDDAMNGGFLGFGSKLNTDEDAINKVLEGRNPAEKAKLMAAYEKRTGKKLEDDLKDNLDEGTESDLTTALLDGKAADAAAIRMQAAAEGWGTDEDAIFKQLSVADPEKRKAIIAAYNQKYGPDSPAKGKDLNGMLAEELGDMDKERATQLAANGKLDPVFAMRYAMDGIGTDEDMMKDALADLDPAQAAKLQEDYKKKYGKDLKAEMESELSGRDEFYMKQSLGGEKGLSLEEKLKRAHSSHDWERGSGAGIFGGFTDVFYDAGEQLDKDHARLGALEQQLKDAKTPEAKAAIEKQLNIALGYQNESVDAYHAAQDSVANNAAMAGAIVATVAVTAATGGLGAGAAVPALASFMGSAAAATGVGATSLAMASGALAGGLTSMAIKRSISGEAYGEEAAGYDLAMTAVNTFTAGAMASGAAVQGLPQMLANRGIGTFAGGVSSFGNTMATQVVQGVGGGLVSGIASGALDEKTWRGPGNGAGNFFKTVGMSVAGNVAGGVAQSAIPKNAFGSSTFGTFSEGFVGGAAGGVAQTALSEGAFEGRWEDMALRFGTQAGTGGVQGGLMNVGQKVSGDRLAAAETTKGETIQPPPGGGGGEHPAKTIPDNVVEALPEEIKTVVKDAKANPEIHPAENTGPKIDVSELGPEIKQTVEQVTPVVEQAQQEGPVVAKNGGDGGNNNNNGGGGDGPDGPHNKPPSDQGDRDALVELSRQAKTPDEHKMIVEWAKEIDTRNPNPMNEALAELHTEAQTANGVKNADKVLLAELDAEVLKTNYEAAKQANSETAAVKKAQSELAKTDPEAAALLSTKQANPHLSEDIQGLLAKQKAAANGGENAALQTKRAEFERAIALSPEAQLAVKPMLDSMTQKALDYLAAMHPGETPGSINPEMLKKLGAEPSKKNYAGSVGDDPQTLLDAMKTGNVRERMVALSEFQEKILGVDAIKAQTDPEAMKKMQELFGKGDNNKGGAFTPEDFQRLTERTEGYVKKAQAKGKDLTSKDLFTPSGDQHEGYLAAKRENMDTKLPSFMIDGKATGIGEANPLAKTDMSIADADAKGFGLSDREKAQAAKATGNGETLPWVKGSVANMVDPEAPFIQGANANNMPLKAGISGTTARAMGLFDVLGANPEMARLALMVQLQSIDAHSYHEIASAANGYMPKGSEYNPANPYKNMGLPEEVLAQIAKGTGSNFGDINSQQQRTGLTDMPRTLEEAVAAKASGRTFNNAEIRDDYNMQNQAIVQKNEEWIKQGLSVEERAKLASKERHAMRMTSRELMPNEGEKLGLLIRDAQKYGDGEGPSFDQVLAGMAGKPKYKGMTRDQLMEEMILSSTRTSEEYSNRAKEEKPAPKVSLPDGVTVHGDVVRLPAGPDGSKEPVRLKQDPEIKVPTLVQNEDGSYQIMVPKTETLADEAALLSGVAAELYKLVPKTDNSDPPPPPPVTEDTKGFDSE